MLITEEFTLLVDLKVVHICICTQTVKISNHSSLSSRLPLIQLSFSFFFSTIYRVNSSEFHTITYTQELVNGVMMRPIRNTRVIIFYIDISLYVIHIIHVQLGQGFLEYCYCLYYNN